MPVPIAAIVGGVQLLTGAAQAIFSGKKKARRELNAQINKSPIYKQNQSILDYYNTALSRYGVSPTDSAMYKRQMQNINRNTAAGISSFQDRRSGQAGISSIMRYANDASLNAEVAAENERSNRFGVLGQATGMKVSEDDKAFQQNELMPWQLRTNLAAMKVKGATDRQNAGMQNVFGGLQTAAPWLSTLGGGGGGGRNLSTVDWNSPRYQYQLNQSDKRLKHNYFIIGKSPSGINIYEFSYIGSNKRYVGVMADEVPQASIERNGYLFVDYSKIDVEFKEL
jgi:hypothetical protein